MRLCEPLGVTAPEDDPNQQAVLDKANKLGTLRILLAEDNIVNQKLAHGVLSRQGHDVTIANDGGEAIDALEREQFDVVLMDVQMPGMDGFEATKAIRLAEKSTGKRQPIIAMTAHAMAGDRELCLEAGMDEYVSKPIRVNELMDKLNLVLGDRGQVSTVGQGNESASPNPITGSLAIDWKLVLGEMMGDRDLLRDCVEACLTEASQCVESIGEAIAHQDSTALNALHRLKGSLAFLHVDVATDLAQKLETAGTTGQHDDTPEDASTLRTYVESLCASMRAYLEV